MKLGMSEILKKVEETKGKNAKIQVLKDNYTRAFHEVLAFGYDERVKWNLPEGDPPYTPLDSQEAHNMLYQQARKLYLFVEGGNGGNLPLWKREQLFIQLLESVDPEDAKLLLSVKSKKIPYKGVTQKLIEEAYGACM